MRRQLPAVSLHILVLAGVVASAGCSSPSDSGGGKSSGMADAGGDSPAAVDDSGKLDGTSVGTLHTELPCEVSRVLSAHCWGCHSNPPLFGAPMPLTTWAATQVPAITDSTKTVAQMMKKRVHETALPMPPSGQPSIGAPDLAVLDAWFAAGAPSANATQPACVADGGPSDGEAGGPDAPGSVGTAAPVGIAALPCKPTHEFYAHASGGAAPFHVPADKGNLYQCFNFKPPFAAGEQAIAWAPVLGDKRVVHHYILYQTSKPVTTDGELVKCSHTGATMLTAWAPGIGNTILPSDVGLELPTDAKGLMLEVHYWNAKGYTDANDTTGVAMCTVPTPRAKTAGVLTLGTNNINIPAGAKGLDVKASCSPTLTNMMAGPLYILSNIAHMHGHGASFQTLLTHNGMTTPTVTVPHWDFNEQAPVVHSPPIEVQPGDNLTTTCTYDNPSTAPVKFGEFTEDEMCFDFATVYPIQNVPAFSNTLPLRLCSDNLDPTNAP